MYRRGTNRNRKGAIAVLTAVCLVILLAMVAFAVDLGYILVAETDLQRAADAAAHAAVLEYRSDDNAHLKVHRARVTASQYVQDNQILNTSATVSLNHANSAEGDVVVGRIDFDRPSQPMTFGDDDECNAVRVRVRRTASRNGAVPLFFARVLGLDSAERYARATAAVIHEVGGFRVPPSGENVPLLPITIHVDFWETELRGNVDQWAYHATDQSISEEPDDIPEVVLFPNRTESSGNFGTVNIGVTANSASYLGNQIRNGISQSDLDFHGGQLALNEQGELPLSGNPGLSSSVKDDLEAIRGQTVIIPLYSQVTGSGDNAAFTIVKFVGVRVMAVDLTGGEKFVSVQPANVTFKGVVQADAGLRDTSEMVFSPPVIVQ